jgi:hypothetical protein
MLVPPQGLLWGVVDADNHPNGLIEDIRKFAAQLMAANPELQVGFFFLLLFL